MPQIVLDATGFQNFQTGVGRYAYNLIINLVPIAPDLRWVILVSHRLAHHHPIMHFAQKRRTIQMVAINAPVIGPRRDMRFLFPIPHYDLYHCLNSNLPLFLHRKTIVTLHDFMYITYPQFLGGLSFLKRRYLKWLMNHLARQASHIIAISHFLAHDFRAYYQNKIKRELPLSVIHEAAAQFGHQSPPAIISTRANRPYFLYYGELRPHKNIDRLIAAFGLFKTKIRQPVRLLIAGASHPSYQLPYPLPSDIDYLGAADDTMLNEIVPGAIAFCFVSLYEAFGLPILEAMQAGTAVITSNISAMPEVAGDAAYLVDPYSVDYIADAMYVLYNNQDARAEYIRRGKIRAAQFSWQENARRTLEIYRSLL